MVRALDLFCGAGGATKGLQMSGFHVIGVDIKRQPRYCGDYFIQADAMTFPLNGFEFIWAGPVCKRYSRMSIVREGLAATHPDQIPALRRRLEDSGLPYVIENVNGSPLLPGAHILCGFSFDLELIRHRYFESNVAWLAPAHLAHKGRKHYCIVGHGGPGNKRRWKISQAREAMGIDWMTRDEIVEAIPPAYSRYIGEQVLNYIRCQ